jgi:phosphoserine phosphatase
MTKRDVKQRLERIRVICFDVDGTLVHHEARKTVWQILNRRWLEGSAVDGRRFEDFKAGRITYDQWVSLDLGDWKAKDVRREQIEQAIGEELHAVEGARPTIEALRARGYRIAVISGTIDVTVRRLLGDACFDRIYANRIFFDGDGRIIGWEATPFDVWGKARALDLIAEEFGTNHEACAFVGDAWNDLSVLRHAGVGIAFHPKGDDVRAAADVVVEDGPLTRLLEFFPHRADLVEDDR